MKLCHVLRKVMTAIDSRTPLLQKQSCRKGSLCNIFRGIATDYNHGHYTMGAGNK
jgi:hypothetical protein